MRLAHSFITHFLQGVNLQCIVAPFPLTCQAVTSFIKGMSIYCRGFMANDVAYHLFNLPINT